MPTPLIASRLAVCSWSLQPSTPEDLVAKLQQTGITRVQLAMDPLRDSPAIWGKTPELFARAGVTAISGMLGCVGEDYTTLESIRMTGGVTLDATWDQNVKNAKATAIQAHKMGMTFVTFHAGFIPHKSGDPAYLKMIERVRTFANIFAGEKLTLGLETGQETAADLARVLQELNCPNLGVNFDPANMILYDKGDPIQALQLLGRWVRQVHIKDATRTKMPGTWGAEVVVGIGEVAWPTFFNTLAEIGFKGDLVIEREAGNQRVADIRSARLLIEKLGLS